MALHHAQSGELIDIRPLGPALKDTPSRALVRADQLEVLRLALLAGQTLPTHDIERSAITLQCLEGAAELEAHGKTQRLEAGVMVYLAPGVPHRVVALQDCALLVTLFLDRA
ncbi:cupin domain-containing protein [Bordetella sp. BOR01]|uniref:cupin domain-containing protein n=1 Tax=Bordetella sp. BOR01 TaxID=2854779 RepID=UPI001C4607D0|nr:cupin domain-containing protein [Bordetella sp. BOR01]MBV7486758.1 cupin domain-containing protein [Bordetella sp. BOR01]